MLAGYLIVFLKFSNTSFGQNYHDHFVNTLYQIDQAYLEEKKTVETISTFLAEIKEPYNLPITLERNLSTIIVLDTNTQESVTLNCREFNKDLEVQLWALCNLVRPYIRETFKDRKGFDYSEFIGDLLISTIDNGGWALYEESRNIILSDYENGIRVKRDSSRYFRITSVNISSESWKQGIERNDVITKIHNIDTRKLGYGTFQVWLMDTLNKTIPIEVNRGNRTIQFNVPLNRKKSSENAWLDTTHRHNKGIEYLGINWITKMSVELLATSHETNASMDKRLIVDLRNCRGGQTKYIKQFCEFFLNKDDTLYNSIYRTPYGGRVKTYANRAFNEKQNTFKSVWFLCDRATTSGGEMILLALQQAKNVTLVGTSTLGQFTTQRLIPSSANGKKCFVMLTAGKILSKTKEDLNGIGISPDVILQEGEDALEYVISKMSN